MTQSLIERPPNAAHAAIAADHAERDREAWNLPRAPVGAAFRRPHREGLNWDDFRDLYYPDSRRHNLEAIVAYGDYRSTSRRQSGREAAPLEEAVSTDAEPLGEWEDEGGALRDPSTVSRER